MGDMVRSTPDATGASLAIETRFANIGEQAATGAVRHRVIARTAASQPKPGRAFAPCSPRWARPVRTKA
jgi:hypothetical protein